MLFLFGLQSLSLEIQKLIVGPLYKAFESVTNSRLKAVLTGAITTTIIQSSSAVTSLAVTLVDSRALNLTSALGVLIGANIGTASTAFLVSFKLEFLGVYLIVVGSILSLLPIKMRVIGKSVFYFGFILFVLDELGTTLKTKLDVSIINNYLSEASSDPMILLYGVSLSIIFQSGSLITGLAVISVNESLIQVREAIILTLGANIGTTSTALLASFGLSHGAKKAALCNLGFNCATVLVVYPAISYLVPFIDTHGTQNPGSMVAYSHLTFNIILGLIFLPLVHILARKFE